MRTYLRELNFVGKNFLSRLSGHFSKFLQNAGTVSKFFQDAGTFFKIFQDTGKFYKIFHAESLIFLFYQKLACILFMCLQSFTAFSTRVVPSLVESAGKFLMPHSCMHANFLEIKHEKIRDFA